MAMWPGRATSRANLGDDLAKLDAIADMHQVLLIMCVARHIAVAVIDLDDMAVALTIARPDHHTAGDSLDVAACFGIEIQAHVMLGFTVERTSTRSPKPEPI